MSTLLLPIPRLSGRGLPLDWASRVLVATDGHPSADAALSAAWTLADRALLDVVSVIETYARGSASEEARAERAKLVEAQLNRVLEVVPDGDVVVEAGSPADVIASAARLRRASLLVIGLGAGRAHERLLGEETALAVARRTHTPLFAVAAGYMPPPRRIVVGMDFSAASFSACEAALAIADEDALIVLANVHDTTARSTPPGALSRLVDRVQTGFAGKVVAVERRGDPATELFDIARGVNADVIAVGGHGQTAAKQSALGPVATRVIRCAPISVLLVPAFEEC